MTLKNKFNNLVPIEFGGMQEPLLSDCEKIADEFAIEFSEWCDDNYFRMGNTPIWSDSTDWLYNIKITTKELLEIFKKEKGYE
jgi:hypothetical protein